MCSCIAQLVYGIILGVAMILAIVAFFTPAWNQVSTDVAKAQSTASDPLDIEKLEEEMPGDTEGGMIPYGCFKDLAKNSTQAKSCEDFFEKKPTWEKITIVCFVLALIIGVIALIWNCLTCCAPCCKAHLLKPLPCLAALFAACMIVSLVVFGLNNKDRFENSSLKKDAVESGQYTQEQVDTLVGELGYSFWLGVGAAVLGVVDIVVGVLAIIFADKLV